jgi:hypothetical protein
MKIYTRYFALSLLVFSSALCHAALQNGKVEVGVTKGESSLTNPQSIKEPIVKGKIFEQGYKVETKKDSTVELCLSNGSTILVNPETLVEIKTFRQVASSLIVEGAYQKLEKEPSPSVVEIVVTKGKIIGEAHKLNPQSSFTIKSPAGVARIRGTVFTVEYKKEKSSRVGNMEVSCVKGSVEVTVNGSDNGPVAVEPGAKMNAQAPVLDEPEADDKLKKVETKIAIVDKKVLVLKDTQGLKPGMKIEGAGLPSDLEIVAVNNETHEVTLNKPVTVEAGVEISIVAPLKKVETKVAIVNQKSVELVDSEGLKPGMKVQGAGLPPDLEVVSVDPETHIVTFNKPITVEAGVKIEPVLDRELLPSIITPVISMGRLDPSEISGISKSLSSGSSLPSKLTDEIQNIADKKDDYIPPKDNGRKDAIDDVIKGISETIERGTQTNPSPTQ